MLLRSASEEGVGAQHKGDGACAEPSMLSATSMDAALLPAAPSAAAVVRTGFAVPQQRNRWLHASAPASNPFSYLGTDADSEGTAAVMRRRQLRKRQAQNAAARPHVPGAAQGQGSDHVENENDGPLRDASLDVLYRPWQTRLVDTTKHLSQEQETMLLERGMKVMREPSPPSAIVAPLSSATAAGQHSVQLDSRGPASSAVDGIGFHSSLQLGGPGAAWRRLARPEHYATSSHAAARANALRKAERVEDDESAVGLGRLLRMPHVIGPQQYPGRRTVPRQFLPGMVSAHDVGYRYQPPVPRPIIIDLGDVSQCISAEGVGPEGVVRPSGDPVASGNAVVMGLGIPRGSSSGAAWVGGGGFAAAPDGSSSTAAAPGFTTDATAAIASAMQDPREKWRYAFGEEVMGRQFEVPDPTALAAAASDGVAAADSSDSSSLHAAPQVEGVAVDDDVSNADTVNIHGFIPGTTIDRDDDDQQQHLFAPFNQASTSTISPSFLTPSSSLPIRTSVVMGSTAAAAALSSTVMMGGQGGRNRVDEQIKAECKEKAFSACRNDRVEDLDDVLASGHVDINADRDDTGNSLFLVAAQNGNLRLLRKMAKRGADVQSTNHSGNSALHYALAYRYSKAAAWLIRHGAKEDVLNGEGLTPYEGLRRADLDEW